MSATAADPPATAASSEAQDTALIRRYGHNGPRNTTYPSALDFTDEFGASDFTEALETSNQQARPLSIHVHIPFCRKRCFYCVCNRTDITGNRRAEPYLSRLDREMTLVGRHLRPARPVEQLHWGGGMPTFLNLSQMSDLIDRLHARFGLSNATDRDYAIEIDPRAADVFMLRHLQALGFNRLSLGVQDFDPRVQRAINRVQSRSLTESLVDEAQRLGFASLNLDLTIGLPHQTRESFATTLEQIVELAPARLSLFNCAHRPRRFKAPRHIDASALPDAEETLAILETSHQRLAAAGYVHIGLEHYARADDSLAVAQHEGRLQHNFHGYTTHGHCDLVGLGVSAISQLDDCYARNATRMNDYAASLDAGRLATRRGLRLSFDGRIRRFVIQRLICDLRLDLGEVSERFAIDAPDYFAEALEALEPARRDGLLQRDGATLDVTASGHLLLRHLAMPFGARPSAEPSRHSRIRRGRS
ncbi:oxygen-independent coproporphyrinogen III oxidase [Modicisalibacter radicis]|uniref:oxygen-independent coproporphyrinogen III oxidase n=1 Tax=Halomonas sp. EAR18 TaxID=2518972 RepID=UPI00109C4751|nr:oxygen-independent coproporphyrinogen III oxidase [Halomonas sp. EAR18]